MRNWRQMGEMRNKLAQSANLSRLLICVITETWDTKLAIAIWAGLVAAGKQSVPINNIDFLPG